MNEILRQESDAASSRVSNFCFAKIQTIPTQQIPNVVERKQRRSYRRDNCVMVHSLIVIKFFQIHEYWKPCIAGELNRQLVRLDRLKANSSASLLKRAGLR